MYLKVMGWNDLVLGREQWRSVSSERRIFDKLRHQLLLKMGSPLHEVNYCVIGSTL
jgi:hypothetical protein